MSDRLLVTLHLNSDTMVTTIIDAEAGVSDEEAAKQMADELNNERSCWTSIGDVAFFTGAVGAIQIENTRLDLNAKVDLNGTPSQP